MNILISGIFNFSNPQIIFSSFLSIICLSSLFFIIRIALTVFSSIQHNAFATNSLAIFTYIREFVSPLASRFSNILGGYSITSNYIFSRENCLKMMRIYAISSMAKMINLFSIRNWAIGHFVENAMSHFSSFINFYLSIASPWHDRSRPYPTLIRYIHLDTQHIFAVGVE